MLCCYDVTMLRCYAVTMLRYYTDIANLLTLRLRVSVHMVTQLFGHDNFKIRRLVASTQQLILCSRV